MEIKKLSLADLERLSPDESKQAQKHDIIVILDNVRSAHNVGSFFRTCDALAIKSLYLAGITSSPPHREIEKTALGATMSVPWKYFDATHEAIQDCKGKGYKIIGVEQTNISMALEDWHPGDQPVALVFGNEVNGLSDEILPMLDACVEIKQFGAKHSFNVSVCGGIVLWHCVQGGGH